MRPDGARPLAPRAVPWALAAHALLAVAMARSDGHEQPFALALVLLAAPAIALAMRRDTSTSGGTEPLAWALAFASTASFFDLPPGRSIAAGASLAPFLAMSAAATALVASYAVDLAAPRLISTRLATARRAALFALAAALGAWLLVASPAPAIDVWQVHQQGAAALLHGRSPYADGVIATDDSHSHARLIDTYAYPPLNLFLTTIAFALTGETRWAELASMLAGGALLWLVARRASGRGVFADLVAVGLLFHPRALFVLEQAWGEPLALPFVAGFAVAVDALRFRTAAVLLGLLVALKQHFVLYLPALALVPGVGVSGALVAIATAVATYAPFLLVTPTGLYTAVVLHHVHNPPREDSLSVAGTLSRFGYTLPSWVGIVSSFATFAPLPRVPRTVGALLLSSAMTFLVFFALGRQAFCNYYYLLDATVLVAAAALAKA